MARPKEFESLVPDSYSGARGDRDGNNPRGGHARLNPLTAFRLVSAFRPASAFRPSMPVDIDCQCGCHSADGVDGRARPIALARHRDASGQSTMFIGHFGDVGIEISHILLNPHGPS
jgi:hypothetical protein